MKPLDFNTLDNLLASNAWQHLADQTQTSIKAMQVQVPQVGISAHVVLPTFQKQEMTQYVIAMGQEQRGPFTAMQIREFLKAGAIAEDCFIWAQGWPQWKTIKDCPQIMSML